MTRCSASGASPPPVTAMRTGWATSPCRVTTVAVFTTFHSTAEIRSLGLDTVPLGATVLSTTSTPTCAGSNGEPSMPVTSTVVRPLGSNTSRNSATRSSGVYRHSS